MQKLEEGIKCLEDYNHVKISKDLHGFASFRALMNITMPDKLSNDFYILQDEIIKEEYKNKKIVEIANLDKLEDNIYLYKGDITLLKVDAIVNAGNSELLGCFRPLHKCIDNAIHSYAGLEVRRDLLTIMKEEKTIPNGHVRVTKGYNLPSKYIIHTVGPIVYDKLTILERNDLALCYYNSLKLADEYHLSSIAFPSISTGLFNFPNKEASNIAYKTVKKYLKETNTNLKVIFVTFKEEHYLLYKEKSL